MFFVMAIAGMVCTALSVSGQTITDLKTGYWLGSTPAAQERVKFLGVIASAAAAGLAIVMLAQAFQFGEAAPGDARAVLAAPQASIMQALVQGFMSRQPVAWRPVHRRARWSRSSWRCCGVPALVFALGMYLPLELNLPALVGGVLAHYVNARSERAGSGGRTVRERGVIVASGFMAGGALGGVLGAGLRLFAGIARISVKTPFYDNEPISQTVSMVGFVAVLCLPVAQGDARPGGRTRMTSGPRPVSQIRHLRHAVDVRAPTRYPSTPKQLALLRDLVAELQAIGLTDAASTSTAT